MTVVVNAATVLLVVASIVLVWALLELAQRVVVGEREAARAALEHEFEEHVIDADALARGLRAIDEAA